MLSEYEKTVMNACANLILTDAIENCAYDNALILGEARHRILSSEACESLYNFKTKLWAEGPDYFLAFYDAIEKKQQTTANTIVE